MEDIKTSKILNFIIITYPLWDIIYSINNKILNIKIPINQAIRVLIMIYFCTKIKNRRNIMTLFTLFTLLIFGEFSYLYLDRNNFTSDLAYLTKIMFFAIATFAFEDIIKSGTMKFIDVMKSISASSYCISISILLSTLGLGFETWDGGLRGGYKGLFSAQNSVTATLLIIMPITIYLFFETKRKRYILNFFIILISLLLIGTKSGLLGALIIFILEMLMLLIKSKPSYLKVSISAFAILGICLGMYIAKPFFIGFIEEQVNIYDVYNYNNTFSFLVSNRDLQINYLNNYIKADYWDYNPTYLFGIGYTHANNILTSSKSNFKAIEMDFYGMLYYSGMWVMLIISIIILKRILPNIKRLITSGLDFKYFSICLSLSVGLLHSIFGGHVIYEALTALYFSAILSTVKNECIVNTNT